jgi:hypothetical protein
MRSETSTAVAESMYILVRCHDPRAEAADRQLPPGFDQPWSALWPATITAWSPTSRCIRPAEAASQPSELRAQISAQAAPNEQEAFYHQGQAAGRRVLGEHP